MLDFFVKNIPKKPRKIIRTIALYESKNRLIRGLNIDYILLAKLTLLELFAPKLFRFLQSKGFVRLFKRLVQWREEHNSLSQFNTIKDDILKSNLPDIDRFLFLELQKIIEHIYKGRVEFELDVIFDKAYDDKLLKEHLYFKSFTVNVKESEIKKEVAPVDIELFINRLLSEDELLWQDAFKEDANLKEPNTILDNTTFNKLLEKLKEKTEFIEHPTWLENISNHINNRQLLELFKEVHNPFKDGK